MASFDARMARQRLQPRIIGKAKGVESAKNTTCKRKLPQLIDHLADASLQTSSKPNPGSHPHPQQK